MVVASRSRGAKVLWSVALVARSRRHAPIARLGAPGAPGPTREATDLTIVSANVLYGHGDTREILALAQTADVVAVQENTPAFDASLRSLLALDFPYEVGTSSDDAQGTKMWSRTPLELRRYRRHGFLLDGRRHPGARGALDDRERASGTSAAERQLLGGPRTPARSSSSSTGHLAEHLVVVGDFNAIEEHITMRRLAAVGLRNAMSGWRSPGVRAWQPSWPTDKAFVPPLVRIDHALHSEGGRLATAVRGRVRVRSQGARRPTLQGAVTSPRCPPRSTVGGGARASRGPSGWLWLWSFVPVAVPLLALLAVPTLQVTRPLAFVACGIPYLPILAWWVGGGLLLVLGGGYAHGSQSAVLVATLVTGSSRGGRLPGPPTPGPQRRTTSPSSR